MLEQVGALPSAVLGGVIATLVVTLATGFYRWAKRKTWLPGISRAPVASPGFVAAAKADGCDLSETNRSRRLRRIAIVLLAFVLLLCTAPVISIGYGMWQESQLMQRWQIQDESPNSPPSIADTPTQR